MYMQVLQFLEILKPQHTHIHTHTHPYTHGKTMKKYHSLPIILCRHAKRGTSPGKKKKKKVPSPSYYTLPPREAGYSRHNRRRRAMPPCLRDTQQREHGLRSANKCQKRPSITAKETWFESMTYILRSHTEHVCVCVCV
jgi:hypothetical protein